MQDPPARSPLATLALGFAFWTVVAAAFTASSWAGYAVRGQPVALADAAFWAFGEWYLWGLMAIPIFALAHRAPLTREEWRARLPLYLGAWVAATVAWCAAYITLERGLGFAGPDPGTWGAQFVLYLTKKPAFSALVFAVLVGAAHGRDLYRRYRERERHTAQLESQLARAQLDVLRTQLQPHFLFNTLHAVSALMRTDVEAAERVVARLSDLLRASLRTADTPEVALRHELEFLQHYVEIQQTRFRDRLHVTVDAAPDTLDALVPALVLQPLVENAIKHAVEPHAAAGRISVLARRDNGRVTLDVTDDGPGFPADPLATGGIGLANTAERLRQLYGEGHVFRLGRAAGGGAAVHLEIPWRPSA